MSNSDASRGLAPEWHDLGGSYLAALTGDLFFILVNDGGMEDPIVGTFSGFADGASLFSSAGQEYVISYFGDAGSNSFTGGNDLVLMAVPEPGSFGLLMATLGAGLCLR
ncbi:MAG: PEP-CTERM sorting domain-containing protein, partial [Verrucomicrobiota bacterium]